MTPAVRGLGVVSVLCFIAALVPVFKGAGPNVTFLGAGVVFLIIAIVAGSRRRSGPGAR